MAVHMTPTRQKGADLLIYFLFIRINVVPDAIIMVADLVVREWS
jgi:hypothetical protein